MNKLLGNLNAIEEGTFEGPAKQQSDQMKRILESFDAVEGCGDPAPAPMSMPAPEDKGQPVSMNVNLNASGKDAWKNYRLPCFVLVFHREGL